MALEVGTKMPEATLLTMAERPEPLELGPFLAGRKVVIFALPGAFTGTCSTAHFPSFVRTADALRDKGVDEIACLSVNDPFTLAAWGREMGAEAARIRMLADAEGTLTRALGMEFSAPPVGLVGRSKRYAIVVEDGTITHVGAEESPGVCDLSGGEKVLEAL